MEYNQTALYRFVFKSAKEGPLIMSRFDTYRNGFPNARLTRSETGVLEVALHTDGGTLIFNGYTHEQFVDLFHAVGSDPDNRVVILTGAGAAFMESISPEGFDFFTPRGYDKIYREGKKILMNILDIEVPLIAAANGPVRLHSEYILLADIVLATPSTVFQDKPHFEFGIVPGDGVNLLWQEAIGTIRGRYFILTRQELDAETAKEWGAVNEIVPADKLLDRAREIAEGLAKLPAHHEIHPHRPDPEAASHHRRRRRLWARIGRHQRRRCRAWGVEMSEAGKRGFGDAASNKTPSRNAKRHIELVSVNLTVNGRLFPTTVEPRMTLLDTLREELAHLGLVRLSRFVGAYDAGRIINPKTARSQAIGGIIWGVGQALLEQSETDPVLGRFMNRNYSGYLVPTNADVPELDVLFAGEFDEEASPLGAKGLGVSEDYHTAKMPPVNGGLLDGQLAWRQHDGGHTDAPNMKYFLKWADKLIGHAGASAD